MALTDHFYVGATNPSILENGIHPVQGFVLSKYLLINGNPVPDPVAGGSQLAQYSDMNGDNRVDGNLANPYNYLVVPANLSQSQMNAFALNIANTFQQTDVENEIGALAARCRKWQLLFYHMDRRTYKEVPCITCLVGYLFRHIQIAPLII